ncbi:AT hook domain-containing protein [Diplocarpon rosae]|nr:AT hook domain-containing protein [Diplocarpon rosae]
MADAYMISSSPPPRELETFEMPSSSPLPTLNEIMKKVPELRTGTRAATFPQDASARFNSASASLQNASSKDLNDDRAYVRDFDIYDVPEDPSPKKAEAKPRKVTAKKGDNGKKKVAKPRKAIIKQATTLEGEEGKVKQPRKSRAKIAAAINIEGSPTEDPVPVLRKARLRKAARETLGHDTPKEKPARKSRAKKSGAESHPKLPRAKVTKVASHAEPASKAFVCPSLGAFADSLDYGLVEAVKRRVAWTPPPPNVNAQAMTPAGVSPFEVDSASAGSGVSADRGQKFTDLLGSYGFTKAESSITTVNSIAADEAPRKRKLIELVKTSVATAAAAPPKEKAPKKKPRTLTDLATSAYADDEKELPAKPAPLLQYFSLQSTEQATSDGFKIPSKPRSKSPVKFGTKGKKGSANIPILLSPESALKQVGSQDFVFGTSSQLAREDSPTLLRDLHEAMQASNEVEHEDSFADCSPEQLLHAVEDRGVESLSTSRNLWSAASRDIGGKLENIEIVDLATTSPTLLKSASGPPAPNIPMSIQDEDDEGFWHDVEEFSQSLSQKAQPIEMQANDSHIDKNKDYSISPMPPTNSVSEPRTPQIGKLSTATEVPEASQPSAKTSKAVAMPQDLRRPNFEAYTNMQLAKQVASYRFKPIKSRTSMISLLEKCWEGKNRTALASLGTNRNPVVTDNTSRAADQAASQRDVSPKRPRGRPKKNSKSASPSKTKVRSPRKKSDSIEHLKVDSATPLPEIRTPKKSLGKSKKIEKDFVSNTATTPSPPRRSVSREKNKPIAPTTPSSTSVASDDLSPILSENLLFKHINSAIINAPRSQDSLNPSWHEKILLYDPIILEDLAIWLNTGALEKAGWDGEVDPKEVKNWCESKSVCCLWRENLRGGSRSRY